MAASMLLVLAGTWAGVATAQNAAKPMRMMMGFPPGGTADLVGRVVAEKMSARLGQTIVVDTRPGASGLIALDALIKSEPDGSTIGFLPSPTLISGILNGREWNIGREMTPLGLNYRFGIFIGINPTVAEFTGVRNAVDLLRTVRANPGKIFFGSIGVGSGGHLAGELMKMSGNLQWDHVPYKGMAPALQELVSGRVPLAVISVSAEDEKKFPGRVAVVGVTSLKRSVLAPQVPTLAESGLAGFDVTSWSGFVGPAGLPEPISARLATAYKQAYDDPDTHEKLGKVVELEYMDRAAFAALIQETIVSSTRVIKANNIKP